MVKLFKGLEPVKVSPIIRGFRWVLLISGILYGISKQNLLAIHAAATREQEMKEKEQRAAEIKAERERQSAKDKEFFTELVYGKKTNSEENTDTNSNNEHEC